ncbi:hypothetical protein EYF80_030291 [Liparis tanakae]|uniref:Uncharacterized protein n=1 Tax=Liparis tanakae TaxID=230148 RepID=A0A4Z2H141_9TELE|nr:hypothetical protein EYF80_030291 [Liparis tanakae]
MCWWIRTDWDVQDVLKVSNHMMKRKRKGIGGARALSFRRGGSPLAGVKYTWLGEATSSALGLTWSSGWASDSATSAADPEGSSSKGGDSGGGGAGYLLSLAAARCRFKSASVWCDFSRVILSAPSPPVDPDPDPAPGAGHSWYEALRSMRPPPVHSSPGTEEASETEEPPLPTLDTIFLSAASSSSRPPTCPQQEAACSGVQPSESFPSTSALCSSNSSATDT